MNSFIDFAVMFIVWLASYNGSWAALRLGSDNLSWAYPEFGTPDEQWSDPDLSRQPSFLIDLAIAIGGPAAFMGLLAGMALYFRPSWWKKHRARQK